MPTRALRAGLVAANAALYLALVIWTAGNVPVARVLSCGGAFSVLHAARSARQRSRFFPFVATLLRASAALGMTDRLVMASMRWRTNGK